MFAFIIVPRPVPSIIVLFTMDESHPLTKISEPNVNDFVNSKTLVYLHFWRITVSPTLAFLFARIIVASGLDFAPIFESEPFEFTHQILLGTPTLIAL